ncbi:MAG TPA: PKD domain-containing protein [Thermoplasmata archaeon]|nr:PKD domain-containing protein [Thermoplasmata archaeon]
MVPPAHHAAMVAHPAVSGSPSWLNRTYYTDEQYIGGTGPTAYFGAAAYDPDFQEVVFYGGCSVICPSNATWIYTLGGWYNATDSLYGSVPAAMGISMAWDPAYDAVLMVGGINSYGQVVNSTWAFYGDVWDNITYFTGPAGTLLGYPYGTAYAPMAWDGALHEMILVDGCAASECDSVWNVEWALNDYGWYDAGSGPTSGTGWAFDWGGSMAYDPASQEMVYFGGYSFYPDFSSINVTAILNATGWWNITSTSASCYFLLGCYYPGDRGYASMTWDGQLDEIVLFGGYSNTSGYLNDTWYFSYGTWYDSAFFSSVAGPLPELGAAMPSNSTDIAPMLIGGFCTAWCFNNTWVFEIPPTPEAPILTPSPSDAGVVVNVSGVNSLGTGSGPEYRWYLFDLGSNYKNGIVSERNFTTPIDVFANFTYAGSTTADVYLEELDFFDVEGVADSLLTVNPAITLVPSATDNPTEAGSTVSFLSGASGGSGTFAYTWGFGDHSALSSTAAPSHVYASAGTYTAWVNVTDGVGWANNTVPVTVDPALTATAAPSVLATDLGNSVTFTATPAGGSGSYASYAWTFGDTDTGTGASAAHTYASAGTFTVDVTVTDSLGFSVVASTSVTINAVLGGTVSASSLTPVTGASVSFTATPSAGTPGYTYAWTFGDGGSGTGATASHSYGSAGTYTVTVVITDSVGAHVTKSLTETVSKAPTVLGLPPTEGYALLGVIALVVVVALIAALMMMRRRRKPASAAPPAAWNQGSASGPGTPPSGGTPPPPPTGGAPPTPPPGAV